MGKLALLKKMQSDTLDQFLNAGIETFEQLLEQGATKAGRKDLAKQTGLAEREVHLWVNRVDLLRIKGMGQEYGRLLEAAGVDSMKELSGLLPSSLFVKLIMLNRQENYVRRMPSETMVGSWVASAKELSGKVT